MPSYAVELHIESRRPGQRSLLDHAWNRSLFGMQVPVLSPVDLFIAQGMHAFKDIRSPFYRASQLLEFRRHVITHCDDKPFWQEVESLAAGDRSVHQGLGVVILLITNILGEFAPTSLTSWTVDRLRPAVRLWVEMYGRRSLFSLFPGTKLYLLLNRELTAGERVSSPSFRRELLPIHFPRPAIQHLPGESMSFRLGRYRMYVSRIVSRIFLHTIEGLRCLWQARRFRRRVAALAKG